MEILLLQEKISDPAAHDSRLSIALFLLAFRLLVAESFGAIYERNAINAAFPVITCKNIA